jgi:hypothetical protein
MKIIVVVMKPSNALLRNLSDIETAPKTTAKIDHRQFRHPGQMSIPRGHFWHYCLPVNTLLATQRAS